MSTALRNYAEGQFHTFTVAAGSVVTRGFGIEMTGANTTIRNGTAADTIIGVAMASGVPGDRVQIYLFGSIIDVLVGTGGATFGTKARWAAANDGFCDAPATANAGANTNPIFGTFLETGVAGTRVGMLTPSSNNRISA